MRELVLLVHKSWAAFNAIIYRASNVILAIIFRRKYAGNVLLDVNLALVLIIVQAVIVEGYLQMQLHVSFAHKYKAARNAEINLASTVLWAISFLIKNVNSVHHYANLA